MSLFLKKEIENGKLGLWKIEEPLEKLESLIQLSNIDKNQYLQFKNESRKKQWLAARILLNLLLDKSSQIYYSEDGKPFLKDSNVQISISHTEKFVAVILSKTSRVGIDIEKIAARILKVHHKFAHPEELILPVQISETAFLCLLWSVKEALFKAIDEKNIIFKDDLKVISVEKEVIWAKVFLPNKEELWKLNFQEVEDHYMVWC